MATKSAAVGSKRKSAPSAKGKADGTPKKARFENKKSKPEPEEEEDADDFEDFSDSEDGGAKLHEQRRQNLSKGNNDGKTFERGLSRQTQFYFIAHPNP